MSQGWTCPKSRAAAERFIHPNLARSREPKRLEDQGKGREHRRGRIDGQFYSVVRWDGSARPGTRLQESVVGEVLPEKERLVTVQRGGRADRAGGIVPPFARFRRSCSPRASASRAFGEELEMLMGRRSAVSGAAEAVRAEASVRARARVKSNLRSDRPLVAGQRPRERFADPAPARLTRQPVSGRPASASNPLTQLGERLPVIADCDPAPAGRLFSQ